MARRFETDGEHLIHVRLRPVWAYIDGIRDFGAFFCDTTFPDKKLADRVRLVIHELLENAIKYSASEWNEIEFSIQTAKETFEINVSNYPTPEAAERLFEELDFLRAFDPEAAYQAAVARAIVGPEGESRLGLARIRFEGEVELSIRKHDNQQIRVTARGNL